MQKSEFIPTIAPIVIEENKKRGNPLYSSVVIAQAICETGWGQSKIMMKANAIFGIKANKNWKGKVYNSKTKECYDGVNYTTITDCFRAYNSLEESIRDYFDLICGLDRYKKALHCRNYKECIQEIKNGGYATSPSYVDTIVQLIIKNNLKIYDVESVDNNVDKYVLGNIYTLRVDLNVRKGAGTNFERKKYNELTNDGKKHAYDQEYAVLKKGTKVTCKDIIVDNDEIWLKIPSGYIAGFYKGNKYVG